MSTLDLAIIGNCQTAALVDPRGRIVWSCYPGFDGDPVFCDLLGGNGLLGRPQQASAARQGVVEPALTRGNNLVIEGGKLRRHGDLLAFPGTSVWRGRDPGRAAGVNGA